VALLSDATASTSGSADGHLAHLVVVGSSAGGIEALSTLLAGLPRDFPAPIVLAQHLDPARHSHLQTILQRKTELPIVLVNDTATLTPGTVYVVPANRHIVVKDGTVALEGDHGERPRPSVDLLLSTAARSYGERLIAVILTGAGSDGAAGAVEVKQAGGTVVIQNPRTARFPSMPLALPPTVIDHIVDIERMAEFLDSAVRSPPIAMARDTAEKALAKIVDLVSSQSSVDFHPYKPTTLMRRISRRMVALHIPVIDEYAQYLDSHPEEVGQLATALLINVTEFFRDPEAFLFLRNTVLPEMLDKARAQGRTLRLWSAGCSTGEEAYSLVLLLADLLGADLPDWNIRVFATDVDEQAVAFARRGLYPSNVLGALPDEYRDRYFEETEQGFRIGKPLRQMVIFGLQDIGHGVPFPRIDLVVCRNLLIYFRPELQQEVLDLFAYSLHPTSGFLFLGKAETARPSKATFDLVNKKYKVYRCVNGPPAGLRHGGPAGQIVSLSSPAVAPAEGGGATPGGAAGEDMDVGHLRRFNDIVLRAMPVGLVVIDRNYRMITTNPAARRLLQIHDHAAEPDFLHAVRGIPYNDVRHAIDSAFRDRVPATLPEVSLPVGGEERFVHLTISRVNADASTSDYALVTAVEVTEMVRTTRRLQVSQEDQRLLVEELGTTNRRLGDMNKDLQDANEELQASNEELMLAQEEMQSTNEEFEATNEELQATNEELETNNEEMQSTNEELETTNEELTARSSELQEMTRILSSERARLAEMVELAPFCMMIMKGPALYIHALNPASARVLASEDTHHQPFEEVLVHDTVLVEGVRNAYRNDHVWTSGARKVSLRSGPDAGTERMFVFTAIPTHDDGKVDGVVLYGDDVTGLIAGR
jgi:two-component system, chemotaxis family, CheB/CheR fusion protein